VITSTIPISSYEDDFENAVEIQESSSRKTSTSTLKDIPNTNSNQTEESVENITTVASTTKSQTIAAETSSPTNTRQISTSIKSDVSNSNNSIKTQITDSNARDDGKTFLLNYSESLVERSNKESLSGEDYGNGDKGNKKFFAASLSKDVSTTKHAANTTMGSDIFAYFNQSDIEVSYMSAGDGSHVSGKTNISYSSIGMVSHIFNCSISYFIQKREFRFADPL
jgi:hypothetical protein